MIKPGPITAAQLRHPKTPDRSAFQGDERRSDDRQGFVKAKRIQCVEGTRKTANLRPIPTAHLLPDGSVSHGNYISGGVRPIPENHAFEAHARRSQRRSGMLYSKDK